MGSVKSAFSTVGKTLSGTSKDAGILGVGQFKTSPNAIDGQAFLDANSAANRQAALDAAAANTAAAATQAGRSTQSFTDQAVQRQAAIDLSNTAVAQNADQVARGDAAYDQSNQARDVALGLTSAAAGEAADQSMRGDQTFAQNQQARAQQVKLAEALDAQIRGEGPSLAQQQLVSATNRNVAEQAGIAAANRSVNPAIAARIQAQNVANAGQQAAADSAQLRAAEQLSAQQQAAALAAQVRAGDQTSTGQADTSALNALQTASGLATTTRGQDQTAVGQADTSANNALNTAAGLTTTTRGQDLTAGANADATKLAEQAQAASRQDAATAISEADRQAQMGEEGLKVQKDSADNATNAAAYGSASKARGDVVGKIAGAAAAMFSDEAVKTDVKPADSKTKTFLEALMENMKPQAAPAQSSDSGDGGIGQAVGPIMAAISASDEKNKKNVTDGSGKVKAFLDAVKAHEYEYKGKAKDSELGGEGKHVSPMAQELEKSELGKQMVEDTPDGKVVDYGKGFGTILAAQAMLNKRLNVLEKKKG